MTPAKADLLHLIPLSSYRLPPVDAPPILLGTYRVPYRPAIKTLAVWVDHRLSFSKHVHSVASKLSQSVARLKSIARAKDLSPEAMHHVAFTTAISAILWDFPPWWNSSRAVLNRLTPAYHSLSRAICQAKRFTCKRDLLRDSGFPHLDLLLDHASQSSGIRVLLCDPPSPAGQCFISNPASF